MEPVALSKTPTGIPGLDHILHGGLPSGEAYLIQGGPGTGKTTLALQFLRTGVDAGEPALYLTLSQTRRSLMSIAASHGWSLDDVAVRELHSETGPDAQTVFPSSEVELEEMVAVIRETIREVRPSRAVIDTISDLRVLAGNATRYRRELMDLRRFLYEQGCLVLFLDDAPTSTSGTGHELQNQAHGIIALDQQSPDYGEVRRRLQVLKMRGTPFFSGYHNFRIRTGGLDVYPRVKSNGADEADAWGAVPSGISRLDEMLGGGLRQGTACLVAGPSGGGKTSLAFQYAYAAAERGQGAAIFLFNERLETFQSRARGLGLNVMEHVESGRLQIHQVNTGVISPSEFAQQVRAAVEEGGAQVVVLDSLSGYLNAMLRQNLLVSQLHELIGYLSQQGVLTLLVANQHGPLHDAEEAGPTNVSYLADSVILLRYWEIEGRRRRTISVLKQRHSAHALDARELHLTSDGIEIGEVVSAYVGLTLDPPLLTTVFPATIPHDGRATSPQNGAQA